MKKARIKTYFTETSDIFLNSKIEAEEIEKEAVEEEVKVFDEVEVYQKKEELKGERKELEKKEEEIKEFWKKYKIAHKVRQQSAGQKKKYFPDPGHRHAGQRIQF